MKLDEAIDEWFLLREKKRKLESEIKDIDAEIGNLHGWLLERFGEVGTTTARGDFASAVLTETLVPNIEDWGEVADWVMENDGIYLLHRRVSAGPWKELRDAGTIVPGIVAFNKRAISLKKLPK